MYRMRTEGAGRSRQAAAVGLGVFVGSSPLFGFHLLLCWFLGKLFGLNRLTAYLAAQISNPVIAPFLLFVEVQAGAWLTRGEAHPLAINTLRFVDPRILGADLLVGWLLIGGLMSITAAASTYAITGSQDPFFAMLVERASCRYVDHSLVAWEFARGKLYRDPIYQTVLQSGLLPSGRTLIDVGCGQGLVLALLAEAYEVESAGRTAPRFDRLVGIETRPRVARLARAALGDDALIVEADVHATPLEDCSAALVIDVLHMMPAERQGRLIGRLKSSLDRNGVILVREADASAGWRFTVVRTINWLQAARQGNWRRPFHYRTGAAWVAFLEEAGLFAEIVEQYGGARLGNVLLRVRHR